MDLIARKLMSLPIFIFFVALTSIGFADERESNSAFWWIDRVADAQCDGGKPSLSTDESLHDIVNEVTISPDKVGCWLALAARARAQGHSRLEDYVLRAAMRPNPKSKQVWLARVKSVPQSSALDLLATWRDTADSSDRDGIALLIDLTECGITGHATHSPDVFAGWVDRLLDQERISSASGILHEALRRFPDDQALLYRQAMVLALQGKYTDSLQLFDRCKFRPVNRICKYSNIADCLLVKGQAESAIKCLTEMKNKTGADRRLLAFAYSRLGQFDRAEKTVLIKEEIEDRDNLFARKSEGPRPNQIGIADTLMLLYAQLQSGQKDKADELAEEFVARFRRPPHLLVWGGSRGPPWLEDFDEPAATEAGYLRTIEWLVDKFPADRDRLVRALGTRAKVGRLSRKALTVANSQLVADLEREKAATTDPERRLEIGRRLSIAYSQADRYLDAVEEIRPAAVRPAQLGTVSQEALNWSLWKQCIETENMFVAKPNQIPEIVRLLVEYRTVMREARVATRPQMLALGDQIAARGRGVFSLAFECDAVPYFAIDKLLKEEDVPTLIARLSHTGSVGRGAEREQAIYDCLTAATGAKCDVVGVDRIKFWNDWWNRNAERIVFGEAKSK